MTDAQSSAFTAGLIRIHLVITRALKVILEHGPLFAHQGFADEKTQFGFVCYVQSLLSLLHAHHLTEDELIFPYFCDKMPDKNFKALTDQHDWMIPILDGVGVSLQEVTASPQPVAPMNDLTAACGKISELWRYHARTEENYLSSERVNALVDLQEQNRLNQEVAAYSQKYAQPDYLVIPFMLYNLPSLERAQSAQALPAVVTQQLVPLTWKDKWQAMLPFLLD